ncbi:hypothetical protein Tco_0770342 [Tanacetum coccineum]|uniref:Uncharacterized protein n=1 Tax=Tanacetum coccineum TaxID=301880 RepID=A0ABQ4ZEK2_9ASTR
MGKWKMAAEMIMEVVRWFGDGGGRSASRWFGGGMEVRQRGKGDDVVVRWWRDGVDDDGGWRWVGMTMVFVAGGRSLAGISPKMVCGAGKRKRRGRKWIRF